MPKPVNKFAQADLISTTLKAIGEPPYGYGSPLLTVAIDLNLKQLSYLRNVLGQATITQAAKAQANIDAKFAAGEFGKETADQIMVEGQKVVFLQSIAEALHNAYKLVRDAVAPKPTTPAGEAEAPTQEETDQLLKALGLAPGSI